MPFPETQSTKPRRKWIPLLIGLVILGVIFARLNLGELVIALGGVNPFLFAVAISMFLLVTLVKSCRWRLMLCSQGIIYRLGEAYIVYLSAFFIGLVTPGKVGDLLKVLSVRKKGHPLSISFFSVLMDRFCDIAVLLLMGYGSIFIIAGDRFWYQLIWLGGLALLSLIGVVFICYHRGRVYRIFELGIQYFVQDKFGVSITVGLRNLFLQFGNFSLSAWLGIITLTLVAMFLHVSQVYIISLALGIHIPLLYFLAMFSLATIAGLLPISVLGLGTRDAALIFTFSQIGLSSEMAVALSTLMLLSLVVSGLISSLAWFKHPLTWS